MAIDSNNTPNQTTTPPAVFVEKLSFRYRSLDDDPQPKRKKSAPEIETIELPLTLEDISFSLPAGKLMLIAGPSGCGKSTLLKCLNGLIPHSYKGTLSGEIQLHGKSIRVNHCVILHNRLAQCYKTQTNRSWAALLNRRLLLVWKIWGCNGK